MLLNTTAKAQEGGSIVASQRSVPSPRAEAFPPEQMCYDHAHLGPAPWDTQTCPGLTQKEEQVLL